MVKRNADHRSYIRNPYKQNKTPAHMTMLNAVGVVRNPYKKDTVGGIATMMHCGDMPDDKTVSDFCAIVVMTALFVSKITEYANSV